MSAVKSANRMEQLRNSVDCFSCGVSAKTGLKLTDTEKKKVAKELKEQAKEFVESNASEIIEAASPGISGEKVSEIRDAIKRLDALVAGELLFAIQETKDVKALTDGAFLNSMKSLDDDIAGSLLFEVRATGNVAALTDERLFEQHAAGFFNRLGTEAASEWFYSIGDTGNVAALTDRGVMSNDVIDVIRQDGKVSSEFSKAVGETGRIDALTGSGFLNFMKNSDTSFASEYLSAIWCTRKVDELTDGSTFRSLANGATELWKDIARIFDNGKDGLGKVVMAKPGDEYHDRGAKLAMQALFDAGHNVIYLGNAQSHGEILAAALKEGASAIGFSMTSNLHKDVALETVSAVKSHDLSGIQIFGGGIIAPDAARELEQSGIRLFSKSGSMLEFLNGSAVHKGELNTRIQEGGYRLADRAVLEAHNQKARQFTGPQSMHHANAGAHGLQYSMPLPMHMLKNGQKAGSKMQHDASGMHTEEKVAGKPSVHVTPNGHSIHGTIISSSTQHAGDGPMLFANAQNAASHNAVYKRCMEVAACEFRVGASTLGGNSEISFLHQYLNSAVHFANGRYEHARHAYATQIQTVGAMHHEAVMRFGKAAPAIATNQYGASVLTKNDSVRKQADGTFALASMNYKASNRKALDEMRSRSRIAYSNLAVSYTVSGMRMRGGQETADNKAQRNVLKDGKEQQKAIAAEKNIAVSAVSMKNSSAIGLHYMPSRNLSMIRRADTFEAQKSPKARAVGVQVIASTAQEPEARRKNGLPAAVENRQRIGKGIMAKTTGEKDNAYRPIIGQPNEPSKAMGGRAAARSSRGLLRAVVAAVLGLVFGSGMAVDGADPGKVSHGLKVANHGFPKDIKDL
ncbi:MAG: cobalamin-dependent protein [Candidatus Micrarchaeota archaeon]|nr:cobalamin-dependent protein [Candidatus Micrarchaeota archaeon]